MKYRIIVTVETEDPVDPEDLAAHAAQAVHSWGGQYCPESDLFPTNIHRVDAVCRGKGVYSERD